MIGLEHHSVGNGWHVCCVLCVAALCVVCCVSLRWREGIMPHRAMEDRYSFDSVDASIYDIWRFGAFFHVFLSLISLKVCWI